MFLVANLVWLRSKIIIGTCITFVLSRPIFHSRISTMFAVLIYTTGYIGSGKRFIATTKSCTYKRVVELYERWRSVLAHWRPMLCRNFLRGWGREIQGARSSMLLLLESHSFRSSAHNTSADRLIMTEFLLASNFHGSRRNFSWREINYISVLIYVHIYVYVSQRY